MTEEITELLDRLDRIERQLDAARARLEGDDESDAAAVADAYRHAVSLLDDYRDRATGTGDFGGYMEFRSKFTSLVDGLDEALPHRGAFETASEHVDQRRLSERNFERAHEALEPAAAMTDALEDLRSLRDERSTVRGELLDAKSSLADRRAHLRDLADIQPDALDRDVADLETPIDRYNEAIEETHRAYLQSSAARTVLATYRRLSYFALLDLQAPPAALEQYLDDHAVGEEPVPELLEYLSFSRSKLSHYVEDAARFSAEVSPHRQYLESLSPAPFRIEWPPPPRAQLRWRLRELIQAIDRFGDDRPVAILREIQSLCRDSSRYNRLQTAARLREELTERDRELIVSGTVHDELERVESTLAAVEQAIAIED